MGISDESIQMEVVALRKESVDRNNGGIDMTMDNLCRSPQGERG